MSKCGVASLTLLAAVIGLSLGDKAMACGGCFGGGFNGNGGWGINCFEPIDRQPPYFAVHPPVHYSSAVPRTYGYSPYAYPGIVRTPSRTASRPMTVKNPHFKVRAKNKVQRKTDKSASVRRVEPLVVQNPFFKGEIQVAHK